MLLHGLPPGSGHLVVQEVAILAVVTAGNPGEDEPGLLRPWMERLPTLLAQPGGTVLDTGGSGAMLALFPVEEERATVELAATTAFEARELARELDLLHRRERLWIAFGLHLGPVALRHPPGPRTMPWRPTGRALVLAERLADGIGPGLVLASPTAAAWCRRTVRVLAPAPPDCPLRDLPSLALVVERQDGRADWDDPAGGYGVVSRPARPRERRPLERAVRLAEEAQLRGRLRRAATLYRHAARLAGHGHPDRGWACPVDELLVRQGELLEALGELQGAESSYREALEAAEGEARLLRALARSARVAARRRQVAEAWRLVERGRLALAGVRSANVTPRSNGAGPGRLTLADLEAELALAEAELALAAGGEVGRVLEAALQASDLAGRDDLGVRAVCLLLSLRGVAGAVFPERNSEEAIALLLARWGEGGDGTSSLPAYLALAQLELRSAEWDPDRRLFARRYLRAAFRRARRWQG